MEDEGAVEVKIEKSHLYVSSDANLIYLGIRPPPGSSEASCLNHGVPWVHVSLASVKEEYAKRLAAKTEKKLQSLLQHAPRSLYLYFIFWKGFHGKESSSSDDERCSVNYGQCEEGLRALVDVLRAHLLELASRYQVDLWANNRQPHVSVLNLRCFDSEG